MTHICPCLILRSAHFSSTNAYRMSVMGWVLAGMNHCHFTHLKKEKRKKILFWTHLSLQPHASYSPLQQNSLHQLFTLWFLSSNSLLNLLQSPSPTTFFSGLDLAESNGWFSVLSAFSPAVAAPVPGNTLGHSSLLLHLLPCNHSSILLCWSVFFCPAVSVRGSRAQAPAPFLPALSPMWSHPFSQPKCNWSAENSPMYVFILRHFPELQYHIANHLLDI